MEKIRRNDLKEQAKKALEQIIAEKTDPTGRKCNDEIFSIYDQLVNCGYLQITSPEEDPPMMHCLTMDSLRDYRQGTSIKPGNIRLNMRQLISAIPSLVEVGISIATDIPILKICAALNIWKSLRDIFTVEITKEQAFVIVSLWKNCDTYQRITLEKGYDATNKLLEKHGEMHFNSLKYNQIIDSLEKIQCVELDEGVIWLREWISKKYIDSF